MASEIDTGGHSLLDVVLSMRNRNGKVTNQVLVSPPSPIQGKKKGREQYRSICASWTVYDAGAVCCFISVAKHQLAGKDYRALCMIRESCV